MNNLLPDVTFVISTYKRHEALNNCLTSVRVAYPQSKVIIINDDPFDKVLNVDGLNICYHQNSKNLGCPKSRNIGAGYVDTPFIFFLDDDATIGNVDIAAARKLLISDSNLVVVGFPARNHINDEIHLSGFSGLAARSEETFFDTPAFNGGACLMRTSFFLPRGYHPRITGYGEEAELTLRANSSGLRVVSLRNGGAIDHFPTLVARDKNLARQRLNDIATAYEYGGLFRGLRQSAAHMIAAMKMRSPQQLQGCFAGIFSGLLIVNLGDVNKRKSYRNWLRLARQSSTL